MKLGRKLKVGAMMLSLLLVFQVKAQEQQATEFSLQQSIEYALQHNANVQNAHIDMKIAKAKVGETRAVGLPQINGSAQLNYTINSPQRDAFGGGDATGGSADTTGAAGGAGFPPSVAKIFGSPVNTNLTANVSQLIFDGSYFVGLQASKTYQELSRKSLKRTEIETVEAVTKAYYSVLVNRERIKLIDINYKRVDSLYNDTRAMYENGFVEKIDVDRLKVQVNNLKAQKNQFDRLLSASEYLLKFQMGMPIYDPIVLTDVIDIEQLAVGIVEDQDFAYSDRIEHSILQTNQELNKLNLKNNRVQYLPRLSAFARLGMTSYEDSWENLTTFRFENGENPMTEPQTWFMNNVVGVTLDIPIFDGLMKSYKIQQNKLEIKKVDNQFRHLENSIDMEVFNAKSTLKSSMENLEVQQENLELAQEVFNVSKIKYQEGVGSNLEVLEAEASLQEAQTNYYNAMYEALIAKVEMDKALGKL
jgi:outer membrane protein